MRRLPAIERCCKVFCKNTGDIFDVDGVDFHAGRLKINGSWMSGPTYMPYYDVEPGDHLIPLYYDIDQDGFFVYENRSHPIIKTSFGVECGCYYQRFVISIDGGYEITVDYNMWVPGKKAKPERVRKKVDLI